MKRRKRNYFQFCVSLREEHSKFNPKVSDSFYLSINLFYLSINLFYLRINLFYSFSSSGRSLCSSYFVDFTDRHKTLNISDSKIIYNPLLRGIPNPNVKRLHGVLPPLYIQNVGRGDHSLLTHCLKYPLYPYRSLYKD